MLIEEVNGEARVSSKVISENVDKDHSSVTKTIKNEMEHLEEFGQVGIEFQVESTSNNPEKIYMLNEEQATYLLTCMRNNDKVRVFKKGLVKAFSSLKKQHLKQTVSNAIGIKEEFEILQMTANFLNMSDNSKLGMVQRFYEAKGLDTKLLPNYTESKGKLLSASELLKTFSVGISAIAFNKLLIAEGFLEERTRPSTTKGEKKYKALSEKGIIYGENMVSPQNNKEVQPMYYEHKFEELCNIVMN